MSAELEELLIGWGFKDVNDRRYGFTPLMAAETAEQTKMLIEAGADINAKDYDGKTALMYAKDVEQMKMLIEAGADVNARDHDGKTALTFATTTEQTKLLIEAGADVNVRNTMCGHTALMLAITPEQTKLLIEAGADVNVQDDMCDGRTALFYAQRPEEVIKYITNENVDWKTTPEKLAAIEAKTKLLIEAGADVNLNNMLTYARSPELRKLLRDAGALDVNDVLTVDKDNITQLSDKDVHGETLVIEVDKETTRATIEANKRNILRSRKLKKVISEREGKVSGTVIADRIAKDVISGKEKRTITPEVGAELRRKKALEK